MFDRRLIQFFDWGLLSLIFVLASMGLLILYSVISAGESSPQKTLFFKQMLWYCIGLTVMFSCFLVEYKALDRWSHIIYIVNILLLVYVLFFGKYVAGSRRWLSLGPVSLQPSELTKITMIITLASYYAKRVNTEGFTLRELITPALLIAVPFVLIVKQPDLGTAMLVLLIAGSMTLFVKIEKKSLIALFIAGAFSIPVVWFFLLKGYQQQRILTFLNPDRDPLGAGYHIIQSKIAIGSGMFYGKGLFKGTQNALSFLPEQHTDFIFSVLSEELGFLGALFVILVFLVMLIWSLNIAYKCRDPFGTILAVGIASMIFWQVFINIGMVMGLMPVVGVPLPFISYGGSSILTVMIGMGFLINISMRRFLFE